MTTQETIDEQNIYCGVKKWHDYGYTGKNVVIWDMENFGEHGNITRRRILDSAPDSTILMASVGSTYRDGHLTYGNIYYDNKYYSIEEFIKIFNIKIINRSMQTYLTQKRTDGELFWKDLQDKYNLIIFNCAGNYGDEQRTYDDNIAIYVGACTIGGDGKLYRHQYSSTGDYVDFTDFVGVWGGTSFSSPYTAGKCALLVEKYGNQITSKEVYEYFKSHCEDMNIVGDDNYTGWGLPIMGDAEMIIKIKIGDKYMMVDDKEIELEQPAIIDKSSNRTLVPLRAIIESMGAKVEWDNENRTAIITK